MSFRLAAAGSNGCGQLGIGSLDDTNTFVSCPTTANTQKNDSNPLSFSSDVISIATGASHTLLLVSNNPSISSTESTDSTFSTSLFYAGKNTNFQLGTDTHDSCIFRPFPLHTARIATPRLNNHNSDNNNICNYIPSFLKSCSTLNDILSHHYYIHHIAASWESSFLLFKPNPTLSSSKETENFPDLLFSCGSNDWSELGRHESSSSSSSSSTSGWFGLVDFSHLSPPDLHHRSYFHVNKLIAAPRSVVAIVSWYTPSQNPPSLTSLLVGWGACRHGQLGQQPEQNRKKTFPVPSPIRLPSPYTNILPTGDHLLKLQIVTGKDHTTLAFVDENLDHSSDTKQFIISLGLSRKSQLASPSRPKNDLTQNTSLPNFTINYDQNYLHMFSSWNTLYGIDLKSSRIYTWGSNSYGQLGRPASSRSPSSSLSSLSSSDSLSPLVDPNPRRIRSLGSLTMRNPGSHFAAGSEHALAIFFDGSSNETSNNKEHDGSHSHVYAWGWNEHGNLGTADNTNLSTPTIIRLPFSDCKKLVNVFAGNGSSWILYESKTD